MDEHANPQKKPTTDNTSAKSVEVNTAQSVAAAPAPGALDPQFDAELPTPHTVAQMIRETL
ncbi:MAG: hypothetical protein AAF125_17920 [Chloroflexota bacterium]